MCSERTSFFVFADTVATRSYSRKEDGHGWLGIRFQTEPLGPASEITIHVRLTGGETEQQQEALDVLTRIRSGDRGWEVATPRSVARVIKRRGLLGYRALAA